MKYFIAFMLLFLTNCLEPSAISATINAKNTTSCSATIYSKKEIDKRVEKGKKLKRLAGYLLGFGFLCLLVSPNSSGQMYGISRSRIILGLLALACFVFSLIFFLIGLAMQHSWN